jgi:ligand-binding sensor domain-containing protein
MQNCIIISLILLIFLALPRFALAGNLRIEPAMPIIGPGESISLRVLGAMGKLKWMVPKAGEIQENDKYRATYVAPNKVGQYYVKVIDSNNSFVGIPVTVLPKEAAKRAYSREKSVWQIVTNLNYITAISSFEEGETLWVGTHGGLEKRNATTGKLINVITLYSDDLPDNFITALADDNKGGLWVGTFSTALIRIEQNGEQNYVFSQIKIGNEVTISDNLDYAFYKSEIGDGVTISDIISDGQGGLWIGTGLPWNEKTLKVLDHTTPTIHKNIMLI